ncbi:glycosyltransferase [Oryzomonas rubra]|uniref:Glycosyltransferase family 1 protein n=1 Tax=Oryzomonas rubra TaxID=2509454 RepID=A0A5A9XC50_9BACT|nr:glycosyltransferase [Oryzomonas rubra]KAA0890510.1 glycosyltransferase family 1 protein [Oryzomonas rubra]
MKKAIWITWENQIRNKSMASLMDADLYIFAHKGNRLKRYVHCSYDTIRTIYFDNPAVVFAQNPSIFLNYLLILIRPIFKFKLVSDAHFGGVIDFIGSSVFQRALDRCNKSVDAVIVTNKAHADHIHSIGGNVFVCEDPLPNLECYNNHVEEIEKMVLFICSFDIDEPYDLALDAASSLIEDGFMLYVTGNYKKVNIKPGNYPHVRFLGFVPEHEFYEKLFQCSIVLDLTNHENCLVCGAYEAMSAVKPLVTSDRKCLKEYFKSGTVFTRHEKACLVEAVKTAYANKETLKEEIRNWKSLIIKEHKLKGEAIRSYLGLT